MSGSFAARVERHHAGAPPFLLIPAETAAHLRLFGGEEVEITRDGTVLGRATVQSWASRRYIDLSDFPLPLAFDDVDGEDDLDERITVEVTVLKAEGTPPELLDELDAEPDAVACWLELAITQRQALADYVASGDAPSIRRRRAHACVEVLLTQA